MTTNTTPEFSHPIVVEEIPAGGRHFSLVADEEARAGLARRFELPSLTSFEGMLKLRFLAGGPMVRITGEMRAELEQACVVSLEPVPVSLRFDVEAEFGPPIEVPDGLELTLADDEPHDMIEDGVIDLGELAAQHLLLSLDPYPRAPGVEVPKAFSEEVEVSENAEIKESDSQNPFAALASLKRDMESGN